ncbi:MAG: DUF3391 domain-containing protein [Litorilituus sp.]|nr:DUF3391 domain-containing protein [Litorilituus sp.]
MIKISVYNLAIGMHVSKLDRSWLSTSFFRHSFKIKTQKQLNRLKAECDFVFVDPDKSVVSNAIKLPSKAEAIKEASNEVNKTKKLLVNHFKNIQKGVNIKVRTLIPVIGALTKGVLDDTEVYLYITMLRDKHNSLEAKSIRVFIFFLAFAKHIGVKKNLLEELGVAAILHDIGMLSAPQELLQSAFISKEERKFIENHPQIGVELLARENTFSELTLTTIKHHHENFDGSGYPDGLAGRDIGLYSRMLNITCMYEALTRNRVYRKAVYPTEAASILAFNAGSKLDKRLTLKFIEALGIYPLGSVVTLKNGKMFTVISFDKKCGYSVVPSELNDSDEVKPEPIVIKPKDVTQLINVNSVAT